MTEVCNYHASALKLNPIENKTPVVAGAIRHSVAKGAYTMSYDHNSTPDSDSRNPKRSWVIIDFLQLPKIHERIKAWEQEGYTFGCVIVEEYPTEPVDPDVYDPTIKAELVFTKDNHFYTEEMVIPGHIPEILKPIEYDGYVYLLQSPTGAYKIGRTKDPKNRLKTFSVHLPFEVEFIHLIPAQHMVEAEKQIQDMFSDKHINGEWYRLDPADVEMIKGIESL